MGGSTRAGADELVSLLGPDTAAARVDPRSALPAIVAGPANDGRVAIRGERDRAALLRGSARAGAAELVCLLGDPRSPLPIVIGGPANDSRVAVCGERYRDTLLRGSTRAGADELFSCWVREPGAPPPSPPPPPPPPPPLRK